MRLDIRECSLVNAVCVNADFLNAVLGDVETAQPIHAVSRALLGADISPRALLLPGMSLPIGRMHRYRLKGLG